MTQFEVTDEIGNHLTTIEARCIEDAEFEASFTFTKPTFIKELA